MAKPDDLLLGLPGPSRTAGSLPTTAAKVGGMPSRTGTVPMITSTVSMDIAQRTPSREIAVRDRPVSIPPGSRPATHVALKPVPMPAAPALPGPTQAASQLAAARPAEVRPAIAQQRPGQPDPRGARPAPPSRPATIPLGQERLGPIQNGFAAGGDGTPPPRGDRFANEAIERGKARAAAAREGLAQQQPGQPGATARAASAAPVRAAPSNASGNAVSNAVGNAGSTAVSSANSNASSKASGPRESVRGKVNRVGGSVLEKLPLLNAALGAAQTLSDPRMIEAAAGPDAGYVGVLGAGVRDAVSAGSFGLIPTAREGRAVVAGEDAAIQAMRNLAKSDPAFRAFAQRNFTRNARGLGYTSATPDQFNAGDLAKLRSLNEGGQGEAARDASRYFEVIYPKMEGARTAEENRQIEALSREGVPVYGNDVASKAMAGLNAVPGVDANPAGIAADARAAAASRSTASAPAPAVDTRVGSGGPAVGTFNGRQVSQEEIDRLSQRNVIPAASFVNPGVGVAVSEVTGGRTLAVGENPVRDYRNQVASARARNENTLRNANAAIAARGGAGSDGGGRGRLLADAESAILRGKRKTGAALAALAGLTPEGTRGGAAVQPADFTAEQMAQAQLQSAQAQARVARTQAQNAEMLSGLQTRAMAGDQSAASALALLQGGKEQRPVVATVEIPTPDGMSAIKVPVNAATGQAIGTPEMLQYFAQLMQAQGAASGK